MRADRSSCSRAWLAGSRVNHRRRLAAACLVSIASCPVAAKAPEETGPTTSASIGISVSVARRYGLSVNGAASEQQGLKQPVRGKYCIASNENEMRLPVMLILVSGRERNEDTSPAPKQTVQLVPCESSRRPLDDSDSFDGPAIIQEVIVRPE